MTTVELKEIEEIISENEEIINTIDETRIKICEVSLEKK